MEPKVGSLMNVGNQLYLVQRGKHHYNCPLCSFMSEDTTDCDICSLIKCNSDDRMDKQSVVFIAIEKTIDLFGKSYNSLDVIKALKNITPIK